MALFIFLMVSPFASAQSKGGFLLHAYEYQRALKEIEAKKRTNTQQKSTTTQQRNTTTQQIYNSAGHFVGSSNQQRQNYQSQGNGTQVYNSAGHFVSENPEQAEQVRRWNEAIQQGANDAYNEALLDHQRNGSNNQSKTMTVSKKQFNKDIDREVRAYNATKRSGVTASEVRYYNHIKNFNQKMYGSQRGK